MTLTNSEGVFSQVAVNSRYSLKLKMAAGGHVYKLTLMESLADNHV